MNFAQMKEKFENVYSIQRGNESQTVLAPRKKSIGEVNSSSTPFDTQERRDFPKAYQDNVESVKGIQAEKETKETPLAYLQEKILTWTIREVTPFGVKHEFNTEGQTSGTLYSAQHIETANLFMKLDGTFDMEARAIEITKEGDQLTFSYKGVAGKPTGPTELSYETQAFITTPSTRLAQLNNLRIRTEGHVNFASREIGIKYYTLKA